MQICFWILLAERAVRMHHANTSFGCFPPPLTSLGYFRSTQRSHGLNAGVKALVDGLGWSPRSELKRRFQGLSQDIVRSKPMLGSERLLFNFRKLWLFEVLAECWWKRYCTSEDVRSLSQIKSDGAYQLVQRLFLTLGGSSENMWKWYDPR